MKTILSTSAAALVMSSTALAMGNAIVNNNCDFDVYAWHITSSDGTTGPHHLPAGSGTYSEQFMSCSSGGVSIKLSNNSDMGNSITQFEYTLEPNMVFYDISNVNCVGADCPFQQGGMSLTPSGGDCFVVNCPAGDLICAAAYTVWNDDFASHGCATEYDLTMELCPGGSGSGSSSSSSSDSSSGYIGDSSSSSAAPSSTSSKASSSAKVYVAEATPSSTPTPTPSSSSTTTLATTTKKTSVKAKPSSSPVTTAPAELYEDGSAVIQWITEDVVVTAYSTVIVNARDASHEDFHKHKARHAAHPHARRHHHA